MRKYLLMMFFITLAVNLDCISQDNSSYKFSSYDWVQNKTTIPFYSMDVLKKGEHNFFSGMRIVLDLPVNYIIQANSENKLDLPTISSAPKLGIETNLYEAYVSLQASLLLPSTLKFKKSALAYTRLQSDDGSFDTDWGYSFGLSFFDGFLSISISYIMIDENSSFKTAEDKIWARNNLSSIPMIMISFQTVSTFSNLLGQMKK